MKMNNREIQKIFRAFIQEKIPSSREKCPSPEKLWELFGSPISGKKNEEIIDHITNCTYCLKEFDSFLALFRDERKFIEETETVFGQTRPRQASQKKKISKIFLSSISWKFPLVAALAIVLIFFVTLSTIKLLLTKKIEERESLPGLFQLIEPRQAREVKAPIVFRWEEMKEREYYILEIFSESLLPYWKSPKLFDSYLELPNSVFSEMSKGRSYFWMISVYLSDGAKIESGLEEFILSE